MLVLGVAAALVTLLYSASQRAAFVPPGVDAAWLQSLQLAVFVLVLANLAMLVFIIVAPLTRMVHALHSSAERFRLTQSLVELHGGIITVESEPGCGSTFCFTLPVSHFSQEFGND